MSINNRRIKSGCTAVNNLFIANSWMTWRETCISTWCFVVYRSHHGFMNNSLIFIDMVGHAGLNTKGTWDRYPVRQVLLSTFYPLSYRWKARIVHSLFNARKITKLIWMIINIINEYFKTPGFSLIHNFTSIEPIDSAWMWKVLVYFYLHIYIFLSTYLFSLIHYTLYIWYRVFQYFS